MVSLTITTWTPRAERTSTEHNTYDTVADARTALDVLVWGFTGDRYRVTDRSTVVSIYDTHTYTLTVFRISAVIDWTLAPIDTSYYRV